MSVHEAVPPAVLFLKKTYLFAVLPVEAYSSCALSLLLQILTGQF